MNKVKKNESKGVTAHAPQRAPLVGEVVGKNTKPKKNKELVVSSSDNSIIAGVTTKELEAALATQTEQRKLISNFVQKHLKMGVDFGTIDGESKNGKKFTSGKVLFKPGQEKIFSLFQLTAKLSKDVETIEMIGEANAKGIIAFKCDVYRGDKWIAEGRGACAIGDKGRDANSAIKIAQKRARMDACLALGFSEYFNQDLEDPEYKQNAEREANRKAEEYERANPYGLDVRDRKAPADDAERQVLGRLMLMRGIATTEAQLATLVANDIDNPKSMTSGQIRDFINKLKYDKFERPVTNPDKVIEDLGDDISLDDIPDLGEADKPKKPNGSTELEVDKDFINAIQDRYAFLNFNERGNQWFMREVRGTPFKALWSNFDDEHWRKAYDLIQDVLDSNVELPDHYFKGSKNINTQGE